MSFAQESGYTPSTIQVLMTSVMTEINTQFGTSYTYESFVGTNHYKYFYALIQKLQANEVKTSEIFLYLTQYITVMNQRISRPVVTSPGIVEKLAEEGYIASVKPMIDANAGKIHICVDTDETDPDYAATKIAICTLISEITVGGAVTQGTESEAIVLSNGQSFDFKYNLPTRIPTLLKLTITLSENNQVVVGDPEETKLLLLANIQARYSLGKNFEPQRYFSVADAPWAASVLLEYSEDDGSPSYSNAIFVAEYNEIFDISLENIELVEA